jgi:DNA-binding ferritin-like protein
LAGSTKLNQKQEVVMTTNPALQKLAERLAKATPEELTGFAERLAKRADCIGKAKEHLGKAVEGHEKLMEHLDDLKDKADELAGKAADAGDLQKSTDGIKEVHGNLQKAAEVIGKAHEDIAGSLEDYEDEANETVDAGIAAAQKHPDLATQKMVKMLQRQQVQQGRQFEKMLKASNDQLAAVVLGLTNGLTKSAEHKPAPGPTPMRTAITIEKSADGSGATHMVKLNGQPAPDITSSVSPVLADGVTPNPDFTKLAESQGDACQKALRSAVPQTGNPFVGIEELVSKRA